MAEKYVGFLLLLKNLEVTDLALDTEECFIVEALAIVTLNEMNIIGTGNLTMTEGILKEMIDMTEEMIGDFEEADPVALEENLGVGAEIEDKLLELQKGVKVEEIVGHLKRNM